MPIVSPPLVRFLMRQHHALSLISGESMRGRILIVANHLLDIVTLIVLGRKGPHGFPFRRPHSHFPIH